jgi:hypothetical protein
MLQSKTRLSPFAKTGLELPLCGLTYHMPYFYLSHAG